MDFNPVDDTILLAAAKFKSLAAGAVSDAVFRDIGEASSPGPQATDAAGTIGAGSAVVSVRVGLDIDVASMTAADGFRILGADAADFAGMSVSSALAINGDVFDDVIVGARLANGPENSRTFAGESIIVFGKSTGFANLGAAGMAETEGFRIFGADSRDYAGWSVSSAGDINGDGFDDLIIGARGGDGPTNTDGFAGEAIVLFGKANGLTDIDLSSLAPTDGFRIFGTLQDLAGDSVSSAGDINGDGIGRGQAGEAIVVFGKSVFANIDAATMTAAEGFRIFGADGDDGAGRSVSKAGDINGDGFTDLIIGAPRGTDRETAATSLATRS